MLNKAKIALTDSLGCALAGAQFESSDIVLDYLRDVGGAPQATIIGTDLKTSLADAALANGMLSSGCSMTTPLLPFMAIRPRR